MRPLTKAVLEKCARLWSFQPPDGDLYRACVATAVSEAKPPLGEGVINNVTCTARAAIITVCGAGVAQQ